MNSATPPIPSPIPAQPLPQRVGAPTSISALIVVIVVIVILSEVAIAVVYVLMGPIPTAPGPGKPRITFTDPTPLSAGNGFQFSVADVSRVLALSNYRVNMQVNFTAPDDPTTPPTLVDGARMFTFAADLGGTFAIWFTDVHGSGDLANGDWFTVNHNGALPVGATFTVSLLWSDGSPLRTMTYP